MSYDVLKNRLSNGNPYLLTTAMDRINALADNLAISQEQADELTSLAKQYGLDTMPENLENRVETLEATKANQTDVDELNEALNLILTGYTGEEAVDSET